MPKRFFLFFALTAAFLVTACAETGADEPIATPGNSTGGGCLDTLYTRLEQPSDTNYGNDSDGYHLNWEKDDAVRVLCADYTNAEIFALSKGKSIAQNKSALLTTAIYGLPLIRFIKSYFICLNSSGRGIFLQENATCTDELFTTVQERAIIKLSKAPSSCWNSVLVTGRSGGTYFC